MPINPANPPSQNPEGRIWERLADLERQLRTVLSYFSGGASMQVPVVDALPPAGRAGRLLMLSSDHKLYADTGAAWVAQT